MRELTAAERKAYDKMVLGSRQMSIKDILKSETTNLESAIDNSILENDSKIIYSQMELFK